MPIAGNIFVFWNIVFSASKNSGDRRGTGRSAQRNRKAAVDPYAHHRCTGRRTWCPPSLTKSVGKRLVVKQKRRHISGSGDILQNMLAGCIQRLFQVLHVERFDFVALADLKHIAIATAFQHPALDAGHFLHRGVNNGTGLFDKRHQQPGFTVTMSSARIDWIKDFSGYNARW